MDLLAYFYKNYPQRTILAFLAITLAGAITGISISALLPLLSKALSSDYDKTTEFDQYFLLIGIEPTFSNLLIFIVTGVILKSIILSGANIYAGFTVAKIIKDLRRKLLSAMSSAEWKFFADQPGGKIAASLMYESDRAGSGYMNSLNILATLTQILAYLSVAIFVSWPIVILAIATSLLLAILLNYFIVINRRLGVQITALSRDITTKLTDSTRSIKSLKAMARETHSNALLDSYTKQLKHVAKQGVVSSNLLSMFQEIILALAIAGGVYYSLSSFETSIEAVIVLTISFSRSVKLFAKAQKQYQVFSNQISGYHGIMESIRNAEINRESRTGTNKINLSNNIYLNNISFSHGKNIILENAQATILHKKLNTIIGVSGAGKTTLIDLICGLYSPTQGSILIGDNSLESLDVSHWRKQIGYVVQENNLLNTSIRENITLGDNSFSDESILLALKKSHAESFVSKLPEKLNTLVGENGTKLSGGQRQRILIARAIVHSPKLLILDEATSALDKDTERLLSEVFSELSKEITIISVSHRPALVEISDHIIELRSKKLIEHN